MMYGKKPLNQKTIKKEASNFQDELFQFENDKLEAQLELWREHRQRIPYKED